MKQCWTDGDLRAYVDGELPLVGEHLETCAECSARYRELSARAARVSSLIALLPETMPAEALAVMPARSHRGRQWAVAALSLAAALAVGFVALPKRAAPPAPVAEAPAMVPAPVEVSKLAPPKSRPAVRRAPARAEVLRADFLRLDDEPLETGTVVRVSAENGDVRADLIVGPDGRAHAIRVVSNQ
jgi:anti-sigma factor RsiW